MQISLFDKDKLITTQNIRIGSVTTKEQLAPFAKSSGHFEQLVTELLDHELAGFAKLYQKDRQLKNLIVIGGNPVSYTHLDVYKRQGHGLCFHRCG